MNIKNKHVSGFTLIELMIGIILSSLFIGGIGQVFTRTTQSFRTQKTLSNTMEDARFILDALNKEIRRTGYLSNALLAGEDSTTIFHNKVAIDYTSGTYSIRNNGIATPGNFLTMDSREHVQGGVNAAAPVSDSLIIRYQLHSATELTDNTYSACTNGFVLQGGENDTDRHVITIVFYIKANTTVGSNVLYCRAARENLDTNDFQQLNSKPLISNVERFRVLYGETDPTGTAYRTSAQVTSWEDVESIRLSIVLHSEEQDILTTDAPNYTLNGKKFSIAPIKPAEKRVYRVFSTTIAFRNKV
jgi:type IV pilus assembly protein PilW